jgi:hypothetical protein
MLKCECRVPIRLSAAFLRPIRPDCQRHQFQSHVNRPRNSILSQQTWALRYLPRREPDFQSYFGISRAVRPCKLYIQYSFGDAAKFKARVNHPPQPPAGYKQPLLCHTMHWNWCATVASRSSSLLSFQGVANFSTIDLYLRRRHLLRSVFAM